MTRHTPMQPQTCRGKEHMARALLNTFHNAGWSDEQICDLGRLLTVVAQMAITERLRTPSPLVPRRTDAEEAGRR